MKKLLILIIPLLLFGCGSTKTVYVPINSTHTEYQTVHDTIVNTVLTPFKDSVSIKDTLSVLSNKYAKSVAEWSQGRLNHSLTIKAVIIPVKVQYVNKTVRDSVQVPYKVEVLKQVNILTAWQKFQIRWFKIICVAFLIYFGWTKRKYILGLIKML